MIAIHRWPVAFAVCVCFAAPVGAQGREPRGKGSQALTEAIARAAQPADLAELILITKERALGEPFDAAIRATLKTRMETLPMEGLTALAQQGEFADIPAALGSVTSDLVYTPVTPCRLFDSRVSQGGPGPIAANSQRNILVTGTIGFPMQGGAVGGCGVPVGATSVVINFVTVLPAGPGNIRAWAVADPQPPAPLAAVLNYGTVTGLPAIANGVPVPVCNPAATSCLSGDLRLQADTSATDILGDVVGYFGPATGLVTSVNSLTGPVTIAAGSNISVTPSGSTLTIANTAPVNPGTVTSVATGAGLVGGPISGSGTISVATGGITSAMIGSGQVVKGLNGVVDTVTIAGSGAATVSTVGNTITVGAPPLPSGAMLMGPPGDTTLIGAGYTELPGGPEFWRATATTAGVPSARNSHTVVWTGSRMIVWGGAAGVTPVNTGGQYDPVGNTWTATAAAGAPSVRYGHTAVWTGTRMIVWGGLDGAVDLNTGGQYDPVGDTWAATATTAGVPSGRSSHTAVWTGTRMVVWGGSGGGFFNTGGRYDPVGDSWTATATTAGVPSARYAHTAVWTGTRMIVWGGTGGGGDLNTGGQYDPVGDSWTATATTASVPSARYLHRAVWTGTRMIVWGGYGGVFFNTGGQYDPVGDSWTATATTASVPSARYFHTAVWTGTRMIVWGGYGGAYFNTGGQYDPVGDSWTAMATPANVPSGRYAHTATWTGSRMLVWGGHNLAAPLNTGGQWFELSYFVQN